MKWYWWILIVVIVLIIVYFVWKQNHPSKRIIIKSLNGQFGDLLDDSLTSNEATSRKIVQDLIDLSNKTEREKGVGTFGYTKIKELAANQGVQVLLDTDTHTLEYNTKRVIVKITKPQCIKAPCYDIIEIVSVG